MFRRFFPSNDSRVLKAKRLLGFVIIMIGALATVSSFFYNPAGADRSKVLNDGPYVNLRERRDVMGLNVEGETLSKESFSNQAEPLSLASADLDEDGVPDLISGYADAANGVVMVQRGNVDALWPYGDAARNGPPAPFLQKAASFVLPTVPDFVSAGDFDADGHWDVVAATRR